MLITAIGICGWCCTSLLPNFLSNLLWRWRLRFQLDSQGIARSLRWGRWTVWSLGIWNKIMYVNWTGSNLPISLYIRDLVYVCMVTLNSHYFNWNDSPRSQITKIIHLCHTISRHPWSMNASYSNGWLSHSLRHNSWDLLGVKSMRGFLLYAMYTWGSIMYRHTHTWYHMVLYWLFLKGSK